MLRSLLAALALAISCLLTSHVQAQTIGTPSGHNSYYTSLIATQSFIGQRFVTPGSGLSLQQFSMAASTWGTQTVIAPRIYEVASGGATGTGGPFATTTVWTGTNVIVNSTAPIKIDFDIPGGLPLDSTKVYALGLAYISGDDAKVHHAAVTNEYTQGASLNLTSGGWNGYGGVRYFSATFAAGIPTLSEWAMILFTGCLALGAGWIIYRRRSLTA